MSIIQGLCLLEMLCPYGEARVVGSVALDLVVKPDIDIHLLTESDDIQSIASDIRQTLLTRVGKGDVVAQDYQQKGAVKVGIDAYPGRLAAWSIDIWVTNRREATGFALMDRLNAQLTAEQRKAILNIKQALFARGALQDGMSLRVYLAVVDRGIRCIAEFDRLADEIA